MPSAPPAPAYRGRFAPSPTGPLHFGSLLAAFGSWLRARAAGGEWLVRIEDIDRQREVPGAAEAQLRTLAAFGLESDQPPLRQSDRGEHYRQALDQLLASGRAFACHCSRSDLMSQHGVHHRCVGGRARSASIRFRVQPDQDRVCFADQRLGTLWQDVWNDVGDFVLLRSDGCWAYQLAVVVDDALQGTSEVVRGADLLDSTPRQHLLQDALGLPHPRHLHLPLVLDVDGRKLSKSSAALPVDEHAPIETLRRLWICMGQAPGMLPERASLSQLLRHAVDGFRLDRLPEPALPPGLRRTGAV